MYLGIDIGTTATKAILIDADQAVLARGEVAYPTAHPAPGLCEQDPALWIDAVERALAAVRAAAPDAYAAIAGIGLSGQMHSLLGLDAADAPLRPALLWNDARGAAECDALTRAVPAVGRISGVLAMPSFTAAKLMWLRGHEPDVFRRLAQVLLPKDYVRLWLTGEKATDMSDAAGTQLFDQGARRWSAPLLAAVGIDAHQVPPLRESLEPGGRVRPAVAARLGLPAGIPVAAGGGDAGTGALGLGCVTHGASFMSLGTGATFVVAQNVYAPRPETVLHDFAHCLPGLWYQMAALLNGASCLAWAARLTGSADVGALLADVERRHTGPSRLMFLPYLNGERTPHNDMAARGCLIGLDSSTDAVDVAQAVVEGVAFALCDAMAALRAAGCAFETPGLIGGGARSLFWTRLIATVLGQPIRRFEAADLGPALGAARLGMLVTGDHRVADVATPPRGGSVIEPVAALTGAYADHYQRFRALYPALKALPEGAHPARP